MDFHKPISTSSTSYFSSKRWQKSKAQDKTLLNFSSHSNNEKRKLSLQPTTTYQAIKSETPTTSFYRNDLMSYEAYDRHKILMNLAYPQELTKQKRLKSDYEILKKQHRFLRIDDEHIDNWEVKLARRYYDKLFKEYVICDLSQYQTGKVGFRWRTEGEVVQGKGQFFCANKKCNSKQNLTSYEVNFKYKEEDTSKYALVKARVCIKCAYKLNYKHMKQWLKNKSDISFQQKEIPSIKSQTNDIDLSNLQMDGIFKTEQKNEDEFIDQIQQNEKAKKEIESLAWKDNSEVENATNEDEFDNFLKDMLL